MSYSWGITEDNDYYKITPRDVRNLINDRMSSLPIWARLVFNRMLEDMPTLLSKEPIISIKYNDVTNTHYRVFVTFVYFDGSDWYDDEVICELYKR